MDSEQESERQEPDQTEQRDGDGQDYVDRSKIDFDPEDGLYTGTAVEGTSEIPGPHEHESGDSNSGSEQDDQPRRDEQQQ